MEGLPRDEGQGMILSKAGGDPLGGCCMGTTPVCVVAAGGLGIGVLYIALAGGVGPGSAVSR